MLTGSLKHRSFDLLTTNLDQKCSELKMHVSDEKGGNSTKSKTRFLLGNYYVSYKVFFQKLKLVKHVYHSTSLEITGTHKPCLEKKCFRLRIPKMARLY